MNVDILFLFYLENVKSQGYCCVQEVVSSLRLFEMVDY